MVIATGQVTKTINSARENSWDSNCKMIKKTLKSKVAEATLDSGLGTTTKVDCDSAATCASIYGISAEEYSAFTVTKNTSTKSYDLSATSKSGSKFGDNKTCTGSEKYE